MFSHFISHKHFAHCRNTKAVLILALKEATRSLINRCAKGNASTYFYVSRLHLHRKPLMGLVGNFLLNLFLSSYAAFLNKLSEQLK